MCVCVVMFSFCFLFCLHWFYASCIFCFCYFILLFYFILFWVLFFCFGFFFFFVLFYVSFCCLTLISVFDSNISFTIALNITFETNYFIRTCHLTVFIHSTFIMFSVSF